MADRFHLVQNLGDALLPMLQQQTVALKAAANTTAADPLGGGWRVEADSQSIRPQDTLVLLPQDSAWLIMVYSCVIKLSKGEGIIALCLERLQFPLKRLPQ